MRPFATVRPGYGGGSLADLPPSALAALGVPGAGGGLRLAAGAAGAHHADNPYRACEERARP